MCVIVANTRPDAGSNLIRFDARLVCREFPTVYYVVCPDTNNPVLSSCRRFRSKFALLKLNRTARLPYAVVATAAGTLCRLVRMVIAP